MYLHNLFFSQITILSIIRNFFFLLQPLQRPPALPHLAFPASKDLVVVAAHIRVLKDKILAISIQILVDIIGKVVAFHKKVL